MIAEMLTHYNASEARAHLKQIVREAVRDERPVLLEPRDEDAAVVVSRAQLLELLTPYECHVEILPEEDGGFTIWVEELRATAHGKTFAAAREAAIDEAADHVQHFMQEWLRYKHTDRAKDFPYVARLALAESREELGTLLFSRLEQTP
jgi:prevent-host-death family protein